MHLRKLSALALAATLLLLAGVLTFAAPGPGAAPEAGLTLQKAVVGAGGPHGTSPGYDLDATGGQPAAGRVTGTGYTLQAGFRSACLAAAPVPPEVAVLLAGSSVALNWPAVPEDAAYEVWVSADPYFEPGGAPGVKPVITGLTVFTDPGAAASLANHFYVVRGLNACGAASGSSGRVGEFTFGIAPGS